MGKKLKLLGLMLFAWLVPLGAFEFQRSTPVMAFAADNTSIQYDYKYESDDVTCYITLLNDIECKITLIIDGEEKETIAKYEITNNILTIFNSENEEVQFTIEGNNLMPITTDDITSTNEKNESGLLDNWENWKETYIDPLLAGVSITSIISAMLSLAMAYLNHKSNKKSNAEVHQSKEDNKLLISAITEFMEKMNDILAKLENENKNSQTLKDDFSITSQELLNKISELVEQTENLQKLKTIIVTLATIESKIAQCSKEVVQSGVGEDIAKLADQIKTL